jgi:hypothetical protein
MGYALRIGVTATTVLNFPLPPPPEQEVQTEQKPATRRRPDEKPHKDLTSTQEEVAALASDIILNGGDRAEVIPFLAALQRYRFKRLSVVDSSHTPAEWEEVAVSRGMKDAEADYQDLAHCWPDRAAAQPVGAADVPKPTTVKEMVFANVREELRDRLDQFLSDQAGLESFWLLNEILAYVHDAGYDLAQAFTTAMHSDKTYVRVSWSQADKVQGFIKLIEEKPPVGSVA